VDPRSPELVTYMGVIVEDDLMGHFFPPYANVATMKKIKQQI